MRYIMLLLFLIGCGRVVAPINPSCTVSKTEGITTITCPDGSKVDILDGTPGEQGISGTNGVDGTSPPGIVVITLCPTLAGSYPEVVFKINNFLYAVYYDSTNGAHEALITPGNYVTTDGRNCHFTVNSDLTISY